MNRQSNLVVIRQFLWAWCGLLLMMSSSTVWASSTIFDGEIVKIEKHEKSGDILVMRFRHQPYSSPPEMSSASTHKDGHFKLYRLPLKRFLTYYIDETPVTMEQMRAFLKPGMRMVTMENKSRWYFLYVTARNQASNVGFAKKIEGDVLTLERPQFFSKEVGLHDPAKNGKGYLDKDGWMRVTYLNYPHMEKTFILDDETLVKVDGQTFPWKKSPLKADPKNDALDIKVKKEQPAARAFARQVLTSRNSILVQAKREQMRVELMPEGWGDWKGLVNTKDTITDYPDKTFHEMRWQTLSVATGPMEKKKVNTRPPSALERMGGPQMRDARGFSVYRLAGQYPYSDLNEAKYWLPIYFKGETVIVDGFYVSDMPAWMNKGLPKPGRIMVCFMRRGRVTADRFAYSSESPVAWGVIKAIDGNTLTIEAPVIEGVPLSGKQTFTIEADAKYFHLGHEIQKGEVLKVGSLIQVFPKRPQTILINGG